MKITIEQNDGQKKEFEADIVAMSAQTGESTHIYVNGGGDSIQWACVCESLNEIRENIFSDHPSVKSLLILKGLADTLSKGGSNDKS